MHSLSRIAAVIASTLLPALACFADSYLTATSPNVIAEFRPNILVVLGPGNALYQTTIVSEIISSNATALMFTDNGSPDYTYAGIGDRLILSLTNGTGSTLTSMEFGLSTGQYFPALHPNAGILTPGAHPQYTITQTFGDGITSSDHRFVDFQLHLPLAPGGTMAFLLPVGLHAGDSYTLTQVANLTEPGSLGLALGGICALLLARKWAQV